MNLNFLVISCLAITLGVTSESIAIGRIQPRRVRREIVHHFTGSEGLGDPRSPIRIHGSQQVRFARKVLDTDLVLENAQEGYFPIWLS
ncbi:unnamed protein product, partial [Allacma fusca]